MPALSESIRRIRRPDKPLGDAIERYCSALSDRAAAPFYVTDSYSFGQQIFNAGKPLRSRSSEEFDPTLLYGIGFPLGVIVKGYAEVTAYDYGAGEPPDVPQAILGPGSFIGGFEFMDSLANVIPKVIPDWVVTAGVSIRCPFRTDNDSFAQHVVRDYPEVDRHAIRNTRPFSEQMKKIDHIQNCFDECKTDVIYFGRNWFQPVDGEDTEICSARSELMDLISRRTWLASARIRPQVSRAAKFFFNGSGGQDKEFSRPEQRRRSRAINIFNTLYDLFCGRRPMFIPETEDGDWGPIAQICNVLSGYRKDTEPFVLRPDYLLNAAPAIGFMPVKNIGSDLVKGGKSDLQDSLRTIDQAAKVAAPEGGSILDEFDNIIRALSVRLPAEKGSNEAFTEFDVIRDPRRVVKLVKMREKQFFGTSAPGGPGAEFFKTCIRLDRTS
jgi:hypothetical protein